MEGRLRPRDNTEEVKKPEAVVPKMSFDQENLAKHISPFCEICEHPLIVTMPRSTQVAWSNRVYPETLVCYEKWESKRLIHASCRDRVWRHQNGRKELVGVIAGTQDVDEDGEWSTFQISPSTKFSEFVEMLKQHDAKYGNIFGLSEADSRYLKEIRESLMVKEGIKQS